MKHKEIDFYMAVAKSASDMSYCTRLKVGAVLVQNNQIISYGYNGTPSGHDNCCECSKNITKPTVIHAELNAIYKAATSTISVSGASMFITHSPCLQCAIAMIQCNIRDVYYENSYRDNSGLEILKQSGINVYKVDEIC